MDACVRRGEDSLELQCYCCQRCLIYHHHHPRSPFLRDTVALLGVPSAQRKKEKSCREALKGVEASVVAWGEGRNGTLVIDGFFGFFWYHSWLQTTTRLRVDRLLILRKALFSGAIPIHPHFQRCRTGSRSKWDMGGGICPGKHLMIFTTYTHFLEMCKDASASETANMCVGSILAFHRKICRWLWHFCCTRRHKEGAVDLEFALLFPSVSHSSPPYCHHSHTSHPPLQLRAEVVPVFACQQQCLLFLFFFYSHLSMLLLESLPRDTGGVVGVVQSALRSLWQPIADKGRLYSQGEKENYI